MKLMHRAAWHRGHRVCQQDIWSRVRIPPGCKVFRSLNIAVLLTKLNLHCHCVHLRKINSSKTHKKTRMKLLERVGKMWSPESVRTSSVRCRDRWSSARLWANESEKNLLEDMSRTFFFILKIHFCLESSFRNVLLLFRLGIIESY
jgi:hypothetical protein